MTVAASEQCCQNVRNYSNDTIQARRTPWWWWWWWLLLLFCPWYLISKVEKLFKKNYKTLGASRLVQKLCWKVSKWVVETNRIEELHRNRKTLKEKRSFTRIIRNEGEFFTQRTNKSEPTWFMGPKVSKASKKMVIGRNFGILVFFPLGCCFSCWASASGCGAQIWGCNLGVGDGHVPGVTTSFFPWCECQTIRAFTVSP